MLQLSVLTLSVANQQTVAFTKKTVTKFNCISDYFLSLTFFLFSETWFFYYVTPAGCPETPYVDQTVL